MCINGFFLLIQAGAAAQRFSITDIGFILRGADDEPFTARTVIAFNMIRRKRGLAKPQGILLGTVRQKADFVLSLAPNRMSAVQIAVQHFCLTKRALHFSFPFRNSSGQLQKISAISMPRPPPIIT